MKTLKLSAILLAAAVSGGALLAQPAPSTPAAASSAAATPARIDGNVFVAQLPTPTQLMKDAEAEGVTVDRIEQTDARLLATYKYSNGSTRTYAYQLLSTAGDVPAPPSNIASISNATPPAAVVYSEPTRVYYSEPQRSYYYDSPRYVRYYDDPWDFWGPVAVGVGLGFAFSDHGHYSGGYHGGYHGHGRH
ncbi:MAG: hypothetical protein JWQ62_1981 [Lacunisphaera sp.]|nr:hypothetical protein [Lacunisphaera sp.]